MVEKDKKHQEILLESGTNEVEIMEFVLRGQNFGVNVSKIKQFIPFEESKLRKVPMSAAAIMGFFIFREETIPLIDLGRALNLPEANASKKSLIMVCEFNKLINGFFIDGIKHIRRVSWEKFQPLDDIIAQSMPCITGTLATGNVDIPIVDMETLISRINPEAKSEDVTENNSPADKISVNTLSILVAEDSSFMRKQIVKKIQSSGFPNVRSFNDGKEAYDAVLEYKELSMKEVKPINEYFQMIITDIEMPRMDGLTLCKHVKKDLGLKNIIVIAYSSLITDEMAAKCRDVGADAHVSKPDMDKLIETIRNLTQ